MKEIEKLLQAMVISKAGTAMTVAQLNRDYKAYEGEEIPFRRHGFQQLEEMLRSMPGVLQVNGRGSAATVLPMVTEKTQHIKAMIDKQKINGKIRKPHPLPFSQRQGAECVRNRNANDDQKPCTDYNSFVKSSHSMDEVKKLVKAIVFSNANAMTVTQLNNFFKQHEGVNIPYREFGFQQLGSMLRSLSDIVQVNGQGPSALVLPVRAQLKSQNAKEIVGKVPSNSINRQNQTSTCFKEPPRNGNGDDRQKCSSYSCYGIDELKNKIRALLISKAGDAMWVSKLNKDFKLLNGEEIPYRRFGFQQLDGMLRSMPDVVQLNGHGASAFVFPINVPQMSHTGKLYKEQKSNNPYVNTQTSYVAKNHGSDNSYNRPANNCYSLPSGNVNVPSSRGNFYPTAYEQFVMDTIANYAQRYWY